MHEEPLVPRKLNAEVPKYLETICLKCLGKDVAVRYQTARQLAEELERYLYGQPIHVRPIGRVTRFLRWCVRNPKASSFDVVSSLLFFALIGAGWWFYFDERQERSELLSSEKSLHVSGVSAYCPRQTNRLFSIAPFKFRILRIESRVGSTNINGRILNHARF